MSASTMRQQLQALVERRRETYLESVARLAAFSARSRRDPEFVEWREAVDAFRAFLDSEPAKRMPGDQLTATTREFGKRVAVLGEPFDRRASDIALGRVEALVQFEAELISAAKANRLPVSTDDTNETNKSKSKRAINRRRQ